MSDKAQVILLPIAVEKQQLNWLDVAAWYSVIYSVQPHIANQLDGEVVNDWPLVWTFELAMKGIRLFELALTWREWVCQVLSPCHLSCSETSSHPMRWHDFKALCLATDSLIHKMTIFLRARHGKAELQFCCRGAIWPSLWILYWQSVPGVVLKLGLFGFLLAGLQLIGKCISTCSSNTIAGHCLTVLCLQRHFLVSLRIPLDFKFQVYVC